MQCHWAIHLSCIVVLMMHCTSAPCYVHSLFVLSGRSVTALPTSSQPPRPLFFVKQIPYGAQLLLTHVIWLLCVMLFLYFCGIE